MFLVLVLKYLYEVIVFFFLNTGSFFLISRGCILLNNGFQLADGSIGIAECFAL